MELQSISSEHLVVLKISNGRRLVASNAFDLSTLTDLDNSILGGDGVFPNGPDIITIAASVINTSQIDKTSSFRLHPEYLGQNRRHKIQIYMI